VNASQEAVSDYTSYGSIARGRDGASGEGCTNSVRLMPSAS
jgi:hypothetical protein